jgi:hypothetical protein
MAIKYSFLKILFAKWRNFATKLITGTSNFSSYDFPNQKKVGSEKSLMSLQVTCWYESRVNSYANKWTVEVILWHSREREFFCSSQLFVFITRALTLELMILAAPTFTIHCWYAPTKERKKESEHERRKQKTKKRASQLIANGNSRRNVWLATKIYLCDAISAPEAYL